MSVLYTQHKTVSPTCLTIDITPTSLATFSQKFQIPRCMHISQNANKLHVKEYFSAEYNWKWMLV